VDRLEAAAVVVRIEQRELLPAVHPVLGVVDVEQDTPGDRLEAVAEQPDHRRHHAFERGRAGQVFQSADGRLRAQSLAALGQPPDRHLEGRVGFERVAVVAVGIARRNQQGAIADHLGEPVQHPVRVAPVFDAGRQPIGDLEPLLDRRQQQNTGVRSEPPAIKSDVHWLARDRWQTRQNPRTVVHGGRELRWSRLIRLQQPNHTRNQWFKLLPPPSSRRPMNFSG
jgi:hypothetical protein